MAVTSGFFNSVNGDRTYNADQMSSLFEGIITDGVYADVGNKFAVTAGSGNSIRVAAGRAWFDNVWIKNDATLNLEMPESAVLQPRIDAVIIDVNKSDRIATITYKSGTASSSPSRPSMINELSHKQYPLCYILRPAGSEGITQANMTNVIGTSECPYITSVLQQTNVDQLYYQWTAQFMEWFTNLEDVLDEDAETRIMARLEKLGNRRISQGAELPNPSSYSENDIFLVYSLE